ncbi:hypothetical protein ACLOJK_038338 [Asimina triloba]
MDVDPQRGNIIFALRQSTIHLLPQCETANREGGGTEGRGAKRSESCCTAAGNTEEQERKRRKMNTDITALAKPEYPVVDRNPPFTKTVANFNFLDYCRLSTITGVSVTVGYLSGLPSSSHPIFSPLLSSDKTEHQRAVDGDRRYDRLDGRIHVRLSELRRPPHGLLPQRS